MCGRVILQNYQYKLAEHVICESAMACSQFCKGHLFLSGEEVESILADAVYVAEAIFSCVLVVHWCLCLSGSDLLLFLKKFPTTLSLGVFLFSSSRPNFVRKNRING